MILSQVKKGFVCSEKSQSPQVIVVCASANKEPFNQTIELKWRRMRRRQTCSESSVNLCRIQKLISSF